MNKIFNYTMTCDHCCGAEKLFDKKEANKKLRKYRKTGPWGSTKKLIENTLLNDNQDRSLLDIGGGVGAIQWAFLQRNGSRTTDVDASGAYLETAGEFSRSKRWSDRTEFIKADFIDVSSTLGKYDYVTLDKVVCCYPDYEILLTEAAGKCTFRLGMSFPVGGWISAVLARLASIYFALTDNAYRPYIHSKDEIHHLMNGLGFERIHSSVAFPMRVWVYERRN